MYIGNETVKPLTAVIIGGYEPSDAKGVDVTHLVVVDSAVNKISQTWRAGDDIGNLQSGRVERFGR